MGMDDHALDESRMLDYDAIRPLRDVAGWTKFVAVMSIIVGALSCATVVGAVVGWLPIWIGVVLLNAGNRLVSGVDAEEPDDVREGAQKLALTIKLVGILAIVWLVFMALYVAFVIFVFVLGFAGAISGGPGGLPGAPATP